MVGAELLNRYTALKPYRGFESHPLRQIYSRASGKCPGPSAVVLCHHETEMLLHRREIAVIVQQRVAMLDAEGPDNDIGRLADRDAQLSQLAIVSGSARGKIGIEERHESIPAQSV